MEISGEALPELGIVCLNDPAILLLGIHPKESKLAYHGDTYFVAALFTIHQLRNQAKGPSRSGWIGTCNIHLHTVEHSRVLCVARMHREIDRTVDHVR